MPKAGVKFSKKDEWYTPKAVVDFFGPFDYDPCTTKERADYLGIQTYDTIETDGLKADWTRHGKIWVNPPFTRKFEFLEKAVDTPRHIFFLLPIESIVTKRFHEIMRYYRGGYTMWIPDGRIKFEGDIGKASSPAFGSVIIELWGDERRIRHWRYV